MNFFNDHPGLIYFTVTIIQLASTIVMAAALVSIARSLNNKKEKE